MVHTPVDITQVKQSAATGHFRSIALWLNYVLVPQAIYARVQTDRPGYLQILLEFERPPKQELLIRLVCNRICRLESNVICGVYIVGRMLGTDRPLWQQRVKLSRRKRPDPLATASPVSATSPEPVAAEQAPAQVDDVPFDPPVVSTNVSADLPTVSADGSEVQSISATTYGSETLKAVPSYLIPKASHQERRRRPNRSVAPFPVVEIRLADIDGTQTSAQRRENRRRFAPKESIEQQFRYMRAIVVTGSAAAAFILGCVTEAVVSQKGKVANKSEPTLPTFNNNGWRPASEVNAQEIAYRTSTRGSAVSAALESVAVMPHEPSSDPADPTVTLMFGGEVPVGDVPLQTPEAVGQVLGDLDMFRAADVSMVGLGNSLATADTSLQESYFDRSRPDAVDALRQGGIDIVGLTGAHTMDYGRQGLTETLEALDSAGVYRVGAGRDSQEARRPEVLDVKGQRIAYLSYVPDSDELATLGQAGLNIQERDDIIADIAALREGVDWIVVNYRWYGDLETEPNPRQIDLSRSAIDAGADLVVGYHPEQIQGAELYKSRPIVYSLGDFIFQDAPLADHDTAALRVSLREEQMKVEFLPISVRKARPQSASGETAKAILKQIRQASDVLPSPLQFPAILDALPHKGPLLKPEKTTTPLKTLGELEPGGPDTSAEQSMPTSSDVFEADSFEWGPYQPDNNFELNGIESDILESDRFAPNDDESASDNIHIESLDSTIEHESLDIQPRQELPVNSLDGFNIRPDELELDGLYPSNTGETSDLTQPAPKTNIVPQRLPTVVDDLTSDDASDAINAPSNGVLAPDSDDILVPAEESLPGYDALENWGEKASPHPEFDPIQEHSNTSESDDNDASERLLPAVSTDADESNLEENTATDAISPHHEPLVGPLG